MIDAAITFTGVRGERENKGNPFFTHQTVSVEFHLFKKKRKKHFCNVFFLLKFSLNVSYIFAPMEG